MPRALKGLYRRAHRLALRALEAAGLNVARTRDYYSPLPVRSRLAETRARWDRPSEMPGVERDLEAMERRLARLVAEHAADYAALPPYEEAKELGYGPGFTRLDSLFAYLMVRHLRPRRVIEIGSGLSTYYLSQAAAANAAAGGARCEIASIDPYSGDRVAGLPGVELVRREVQDVEPAYFARLEAGDVLFVDSTHVVKIDGDVPYLYLEVLPRLAPGVVIHSHDVHFPYNVPYPAQEYVFDAKWPMVWTEAMLLQAFLAFNREFEIVLAPAMLRHHDEAFLERTVPGYRPVVAADYDTHFGSIWYRRVGQRSDPARIVTNEPSSSRNSARGWGRPSPPARVGEGSRVRGAIQ